MAKVLNGHMAMQGDVAIIRITDIPEGAIKQDAINGHLIVTHSETGHNHVIDDSDDVALLQDPDDELQAYLQVNSDSVELRHLRSFDTHETIIIPAGNYVVRRQREYIPEGYRRAAD